MDTIRIADFAKCCKVSEKTVRNWINSNKLNSSKKRYSNKEVKVVVIDEKSKLMEMHSKNFPEDEENYKKVSEVPEDSTQNFQNVSEAELIDNTQSFELMTMQQTSFDKLIEDIKIMSERVSESDNRYIKNLEEELFRIRAQNTELQKENIGLIHQTALLEAEMNIMKKRMEEIEDMEKKREVLQEEERKKAALKDLEQHWDNKTTEWFKKL